MSAAKPKFWGKRVRERREALEMSQSDLAEAVGASQATVDKIERGLSVRSKFLPAIFGRLGLPLEELAGLSAASGPTDQVVPADAEEAEFLAYFRKAPRETRQAMLVMLRHGKGRGAKRAPGAASDDPQRAKRR